VRVRDVKLTAPAADTARVTVIASGELHFSARVADGGNRLIVDIDGADVAGAPGAITNGNSIVAGVMTQAFKLGEQKTTRVLVQLARPAEYRIRAEAGGVAIDLVAAAKTGPMGAAIASLNAGSKPAITSAPSAGEAEAPIQTSGEAAISNVRFEHAAAYDRVIIDTSLRDHGRSGAGVHRAPRRDAPGLAPEDARRGSLWRRRAIHFDLPAAERSVARRH
jgi:type IV pilus assembly protein PilQ